MSLTMAHYPECRWFNLFGTLRLTQDEELLPPQTVRSRDVRPWSQGALASGAIASPVDRVRSSGSEAMDPQHLIELREKEATYWWHVNKRQTVMALLDGRLARGASVLEVGCGGGLLAAMLTDTGYQTVAADISPQAARFARERGARSALVFDAEETWPFAPNSFDAVFMLDVLEHLDDDRPPLMEARRVLRPGGVAMVSVPAHACLFSQWDSMVGHRRRYSRGDLTRAVLDAGLSIRRLSAWNLVSLPPALVLRTRDRLVGSPRAFAEFPPVHPVVNAALKFWGRIEARLCRKVDLRGGLSFAALLSKSQE